MLRAHGVEHAGTVAGGKDKCHLVLFWAMQLLRDALDAHGADSQVSAADAAAAVAPLMRGHPCVARSAVFYVLAARRAAERKVLWAAVSEEMPRMMDYVSGRCRGGVQHSCGRGLLRPWGGQ